MAGVFLQKQTKLLLISVCYKMDKKPPSIMVPLFLIIFINIIIILLLLLHMRKMKKWTFYE